MYCEMSNVEELLSFAARGGGKKKGVVFALRVIGRNDGEEEEKNSG